MPELPEVETYTRYFEKNALDQEIIEIEINDDRILDADEDIFKDSLTGKRFKSVNRHGKNLFVRINGKTILFHFGMTGNLSYFKNPLEEPDHSRVLFKFSNGFILSYISQRLFGKVKIIEVVTDYLRRKKLGPDALKMGYEEFKNALKRRSAYLKSLLMNQSFIAGIGNIYSDEILFQSGLHPKTHVNLLKEKQLKTLFNNIKKVLEYGISKKGILSEYSDNCLIPHRGKEENCPVCGKKIKRIKIASRHGYLCPNCQPNIENIE